jgi:hypothetical protein
MKTRQMRLFSILLALFVTFSFVYAIPTGKISGYVYDSQDKSPLPGANVFLKGTRLGASTDLKGQYVIQKVPVGSYTLGELYRV